MKNLFRNLVKGLALLTLASTVAFAMPGPNPYPPASAVAMPGPNPYPPAAVVVMPGPNPYPPAIA